MPLDHLSLNLVCSAAKGQILLLHWVSAGHVIVKVEGSGATRHDILRMLMHNNLEWAAFDAAEETVFHPNPNCMRANEACEESIEARLSSSGVSGGAGARPTRFRGSL